jgi:hypothetical protein
MSEDGVKVEPVPHTPRCWKASRNGVYAHGTTAEEARQVLLFIESIRAAVWPRSESRMVARGEE